MRRTEETTRTHTHTHTHTHFLFLPSHLPCLIQVSCVFSLSLLLSLSLTHSHSLYVCVCFSNILGSIGLAGTSVVECFLSFLEVLAKRLLLHYDSETQPNEQLRSERTFFWSRRPAAVAISFVYCRTSKRVLFGVKGIKYIFLSKVKLTALFALSSSFNRISILFILLLLP